MKKELKLDKAELQNLMYPAIFAVIMVCALIVFGLSLRFLFKSLGNVLSVGNTGGTAVTRFQTENLSSLSRHLPDLPQQ